MQTSMLFYALLWKETYYFYIFLSIFFWLSLNYINHFECFIYIYNFKKVFCYTMQLFFEVHYQPNPCMWIPIKKKRKKEKLVFIFNMSLIYIYLYCFKSLEQKTSVFQENQFIKSYMLNNYELFLLLIFCFTILIY